MDYLFITRIWILLWSCMWACDFLDFSWTLFIFPSVKGKILPPLYAGIIFDHMLMCTLVENVKMKYIITR